MSQKINQAVNQVRLTNVAIVRLKRHGKRFEVACYKNKVLNWRNKVETNIDEVLQIDTVFVNVGKGEFAKKKDLIKAFGTDNQEECCKIIIEKGDLQVSDRERDAMFTNMFKDIATIVMEKTINPETSRMYPVSTIETAMKETIHYAVNPTRSAKQQALDVIRQLKQHIPLERAQMLLNLSVAEADADALTEKLESLKVNIQKTESKTENNISTTLKIFTVLSDPKHFRELNQVVKTLSYGSVSVQEMSVQHTKETNLEDSAQPIQRFKPTTAKEDVEREATSHIINEEEDRGNQKKKKKKKKGKRRQHDYNETKNQNKNQEDVTAKTESEEVKGAQKKQVGSSQDLSGLKCTTCAVGFGDDRDLQRQHYRTDLHRLNLKLKMKNLDILTMEDFGLMDQAERDAIMFDYN